MKFWWKSEILMKKWNFDEKLKYWSKIQILVENWNFCPTSNLNNKIVKVFLEKYKFPRFLIFFDKNLISSHFLGNSPIMLKLSQKLRKWFLCRMKICGLIFLCFKFILEKISDEILFKKYRFFIFWQKLLVLFLVKFRFFKQISTFSQI